MAATIIHFPLHRERRNATRNEKPYAFLSDLIAEFRAIEQTDRQEQPIPDENEILRLLRRIDRRLAKISAA